MNFTTHCGHPALDNWPGFPPVVDVEYDGDDGAEPVNETLAEEEMEGQTEPVPMTTAEDEQMTMTEEETGGQMTTSKDGEDAIYKKTRQSVRNHNRQFSGMCLFSHLRLRSGLPAAILTLGISKETILLR